MQVTIKTLQNSVFKIETELDVDVTELKQKIQDQGKTPQEYPTERQKLIYQGKILDDGKKLSEYNLNEKGFIVLMLVKPKPKPEPKVETPAPASTPASETAPAATTETPAETTQTVAAPTTETPEATPTTDAAPAAAPANPFSDELLSNITAMGFPRDQAIAALRAAFGNPDRAVEYLMNGIPENLQQSVAPNPVAPNPVAANPAAATPASTGGATGGLEASALERIRNEPQFQQIRQIIRTNPHLLQQFIQQMSRDNPDLFRDVFAHQEEFIRMLNEPDDGSPVPADASGPTSGPNITREQDGRVTLQVTESERQAIDRLKQLGFPEDQVIQAYFACDKNEELAANFLLSNAFD